MFLLAIAKHPQTSKKCPTRPAQIIQNSKFVKSLQYLEKEVRDEVGFLCRWASHFSINWYYHFWWVWSGMLKVLKILSMQCLCNVSRKKWVMKFMFCLLINMKVFYKWTVLFLIGFSRNAQSTWVNLQYLCDILRKKSGMKLET